MSRPQDRPKPLEPNTLHDQAAPNTLRSFTRPSDRRGPPDEHRAPDVAESDDRAAPAGPLADLELGGSGTPGGGTLGAEASARILANLARRFEAESLHAEAAILREFEREAATLASQAGRLELTETDEERLAMEASGAITADVIPEGGGGAWRHLATAEELVEFYDPTDLFGELSDAFMRASPVEAPQTPEEAAAQLEGLATRFRQRIGQDLDPSPLREARLVEEFGESAEPLVRRLGELLLVDAPDERITLEADGRFRAAVVPDDAEGSWKTLRTADELVEYYTPGELLDRLAERLRAAFPGAAAEAGTAAVRQLADLARAFADRSRDLERDLIEQFELRAASLTEVVGDVTIVDEEDDRLVLGADGHFTASVVPGDQPGAWRSLDWPDELVEFYDPVDMFVDLATALGEAYPSAAEPAAANDARLSSPP